MRVNAKKCDRCGVLYDEFAKTATIDYDNKAWRYTITKDCHPYPETIKVDLCVACQISLYKWLKNKEE